MAESCLPTIDEILKSTDVLSPRQASATVVRVGDYAVKFGGHTSPLEAQTLAYVAEHSDVPVPKLFDTLTEEKSGKTFIIMEMLQGETLATAWPNLTASERHDVVVQLRKAMSALRDIPHEGYFGSVGRQGLLDGCFSVPRDQPDPRVSGPFDSESDVNEGILGQLEANRSPVYIAFLRRLMSTTLQGHRIVFTHGDLQPKNIMVQKTGDAENGSGSLKVTIIDWEIFGWYPEYWEFCTAAFCGAFRPYWLEAVQDILSPYLQEYQMMEIIRNLMFC